MQKIEFDDYFFRLEGFESNFVDARNVDVLIPSGSKNKFRSCKLAIFHDGQNLFDDKLSFSGSSWRLGETVHRAISDHEIEPIVVVGIWNNEKRLGEYMPENPIATSTGNIKKNWFTKAYNVDIISNNYLRFIVEELIPYLRNEFTEINTDSKAAILGSSMGGLISAYAMCEYPDVFDRAGCLSSSWTIAGQTFVEYLKHHLPSPSTHKFYFDFGIEEQIGNYKYIQKRIDVLMQAAGFVENETWLTARFPGAEHSEHAWAERMSIPLEFLFRKQ